MLYLFSDEHRTNWVRIDQALLKRERVHVDRTALASAEVALFAQYTTEIDDGEAQPPAIAKQRGIAVLSDDNAVTRVAQRDGVPLISSLDLLRRWRADASTQMASRGRRDLDAPACELCSPAWSRAASWYIGLIETR